MAKYLFVELYTDLDNLPGTPSRTTTTAIFRGINQVPGVRSVTDAAFVSRASIDAFLLPVQYEAELEALTKKKPARRK